MCFKPWGAHERLCPSCGDLICDRPSKTWMAETKPGHDEKASHIRAIRSAAFAIDRAAHTAASWPSRLRAVAMPNHRARTAPQNSIFERFLACAAVTADESPT